MTTGTKIALGVIGAAAAFGLGYMIYNKMSKPAGSMNASGPSKTGLGGESSSVFGRGKKQYCPCKSGIRSSKCCGGQDATAGGE